MNTHKPFDTLGLIFEGASRKAVVMEMVTADKGDKGDKGTSYLLECVDMGMKEVH